MSYEKFIMPQEPKEECSLCGSPLLDLYILYSNVVITRKNYRGLLEDGWIEEVQVTPEVCEQCWENDVDECQEWAGFIGERIIDSGLKVGAGKIMNDYDLVLTFQEE